MLALKSILIPVPLAGCAAQIIMLIKLSLIANNLLLNKDVDQIFSSPMCLLFHLEVFSFYLICVLQFTQHHDPIK